MKAELKRIHSPDVHDLSSYQPEGSFGILVQMMIGPENMPGEEAFDTVVCSPDWMAAHATSSSLVGEHAIVVSQYDYQNLFRNIQKFCQAQEGSNWQEVALKISRIGRWEFEKYNDHKMQNLS